MLKSLKQLSEKPPKKLTERLSEKLTEKQKVKPTEKPTEKQKVKPIKKKFENEEAYEGSISIFYAIIFVSLITFIFSLVDITRMHMLQIQALSTYKVAGELALSQYDPILLKHYGLYAGQKGYHINLLFEEALQVGFTHKNNSSNEFLIDYLMATNDENKVNQIASEKSGFMRPTKYSYNIDYIPFVDKYFSYPRTQILAYMKAREPYLLVEPILQHLDFMTKTSKTTKVIEEKNDLLTQLDSLGALRQQLILLIDGISIGANAEVSRDLNSLYIRRVSSSQLHVEPYFSEYLKTSIQSNIIDLSQTINAFKPILDDIDNNLQSLVVSSPYESIYLTPPDDQEPIYLGDRLKDHATAALSSLSLSTQQLTDKNDFFDTLKHLEQLHIEAVQIIESMEAMSKTSIQALTTFQTERLNKEDILEGTVEEVNRELEEVKSNLSFEGMNLAEVDNLILIKEKLLHNLNLLESTQSIREELAHSFINYCTKRFNVINKQSTYSEEHKQKILQEIRAVDRPSNQDQESELEIHKSVLLEQLTSLEQTLSYYDNHLFFNYTQVNKTTEPQKEYSALSENLKQLNITEAFEAKGMISTTPQNQVDAQRLPSALLMSKDNNQTGSSTPTQTRQDSSLLSQFTDLVQASHDTVLINEYAIGMFNNLQKSNELNGKSMNGYALKEHFFSYETEYILGGSLNEKDNLSLVLGYLYGIRMSCNLIHLGMDAHKRTLIINTANTLAGWWTGGVGAIVIGVVIALFWALMESMVDLFMLSTGNRVPLIKTNSTWYTSLDGSWESVFTTGVQYTENKFTQSIDSAKEKLQEVMNSYSLLKEQDYFKEALEGVIEESMLQMETIVTEYENKLFGFIDALITEKSKAKKFGLQGIEYSMVESENPFQSGTKSFELAESIREEIRLNTDFESTKSWNLSDAVNLKKTIHDQFRQSIEVAKNHFVQEAEEKMNQTIEAGIGELNQLLEEAMDEGLDVSKDMLHKKADEIKASITKEIKTVTPEKKSTFKFVPSFTYEDYLRLFLLLPLVDDTTKVSRIMDLIQLNLQKNRDDYTLNFSNYFSGLSVAGTIQVKATFVPSVKRGVFSQDWEMGVQPFEVSYEK